MWDSVPSNRMGVSLLAILFPKTETNSVAHRASYLKGIQLLSAMIEQPGHKLTTQLQLVLRLRISGDIYLPLHAFAAFMGTISFLTLSTL